MNLTKVIAVVLCVSMVGIGGISKLNAMDDENNVGCADCRVSDECYRKNKDILQDLTKLEKLAEKYKLKYICLKDPSEHFQQFLSQSKVNMQKLIEDVNKFFSDMNLLNFSKSMTLYNVIENIRKYKVHMEGVLDSTLEDKSKRIEELSIKIKNFDDFLKARTVFISEFLDELNLNFRQFQNAIRDVEFSDSSVQKSKLVDEGENLEELDGKRTAKRIRIADDCEFLEEVTAGATGRQDTVPLDDVTEVMESEFEIERQDTVPLEDVTEGMENRSEIERQDTVPLEDSEENAAGLEVSEKNITSVKNLVAKDMSDILVSIRTFIERYLYYVREISVLNERFSSAVPVDSILSMMQDPSAENVNKIRDLYKVVSPNLKMLIFKHLVALRNLGNQDAIRVLMEIRPAFRQDFYPSENLIMGNLSLEQKAKLFEEKKALDLEYEKFMSDLLEIPCDDKVTLKQIKDYDATIDPLMKNKDLLFLQRTSVEFGYWAILACPRVEEGWKIHISAQPSSALKIAEIAIPIIKAHDVPFKICKSLDALRSLNLLALTNSRYEMQSGKFIAMYPDTPELSAKLAKSLDDAFIEALRTESLHSYDFYELMGDALLGESGAVYIRYGAYTDRSQIRENRKLPIIPQKSDENSSVVPSSSPFKNMIIRFNGKILPYDNCSEWIADTRYLSGDLLWNEESKYLTTNAAYYESETWF